MGLLTSLRRLVCRPRPLHSRVQAEDLTSIGVKELHKRELLQLLKQQKGAAAAAGEAATAQTALDRNE
jgi:hypothetical protein